MMEHIRVHTTHRKPGNVVHFLKSPGKKVLGKVMEIFLVLKKILFTVLQPYLEITSLPFHNCTGSNLVWWRFWSLLLICLEQSTFSCWYGHRKEYAIQALVLENNVFLPKKSWKVLEKIVESLYEPWLVLFVSR